MRLARTCGCSAILTAITLAVAGCEDPADKFGKTYYLDGAGNWGFGVSDVPAGLRAAGYKGSIEVFVWTSSFNPAIDQVNMPGNKLRAGVLSGKIDDYLNRYPDNDVNIISLSAGTGIAVWAVEGIKSDHKIDDLVLLGSSLSYDYDMTECFKRMKGRVYVYYSGHDEVLTTGARSLGTVDRKFVDGAGLRGLSPNGRRSSRVVNIGWSSRYSRLGWTGAHTDATTQTFVQGEIAPRILGTKPAVKYRRRGSRRRRTSALDDSPGGFAAALAGMPNGWLIPAESE
jgi:hypothetical protein